MKHDSKIPDTGHIDVGYVAHLARLYLTEEETALFQAQLEDILDYVRQLQELEVEGVEPMAHAFPIDNVFRDDTPAASLDHDRAMANAPAERHGLFVVPKIIE